MKDNKYYCEHLRELKGSISTEISMTHYKGNGKCSLNLKDIIDEINNDRLIKKYVKQYIDLVGSSTYVYPITIWLNQDFTIREINIKLSVDKNMFNKLLEKYKSKYKDIYDCRFWKSDGSCASELKFYTKGWLS